MMPAHNLRNLRPWKLYVAHDLMADGGVVAHGARLFVVERRGFGEEARIDGNLADVVQVAGGTQGSDFTGLHAEGFADGLGVAPHTSGVSVNIDVLYVDSGGEGLEGVVVETVQRGEQAKIFRDPLRQRLGECVILYCQGH